MSEVRPAEILRQLDESAPADRELLARFLRHDQAAFTRLVRRHGPMVLAVCRRVVGHPQDAEDAFQAAFLVLAQKAASVSNPDLLGNWLYGVAVRVAQKARRTASRRRAREVQVTAMPDPVASADDSPFDIGPLLHDELAKLPAVYRDAIVLCDLRGVSRSDAAATLGVPEGTLSSRLANGRKKLADRLARRGVALSVTAIPAALAVGRAAVPETLIAKTCGLAADWAAGTAVAGSVAHLAKGGFDVRKILAVGVLGAALTAAGVVVAGGRDADPQKPKDPPKPPPAVTQKADAAKPDPKPLTYTTSPRLGNRHDFDFNTAGPVHWNAAGTRLVVGGTETVPDPRIVNGQVSRASIRVLTLDPWAVHLLRSNDKQTLVGFAPDGVKVLTELREYNLLTGFHRMSFWEPAPPPAPPAGGEGAMGGAPGGFAPGGFDTTPSYQSKRSMNLTTDRTAGYAFAADGKSYRTVVVDTDAAGETTRLEVREVDAGTGETRKTLYKDEGSTFALSPDGRRLAVVTADNRLAVIEVDTKTSRAAQLPPPDKDHAKDFPIVAVVFSADGKRVVFAGRYGRTHVMNADTGDLLPALEGLGQSETLPQPHAFTADGRLVALSGSRYTIKKAGRSNAGVEQVSITRGGQFVGVWDTQTGKALKVWERGAIVAFSPVHPVLATLEKTSSSTTRLGLWDFSAAGE